MQGSMPALYVLPRLREHEQVLAEAVRQRLRPFVRAGALGAVELHVATRLARACDEWDPEVIIAAAAAVRAPQRGHVCLDLLADSPWPLPLDPSTPALPWPVAKALRPKIEASALVGSPKSHGTSGPAPAFIFDGRRLYTARFFDDQERLVQGLCGLAEHEARPVAHAASLRQGLQLLFPQTDVEAVDRQQVAAAMAVVGRLTIVTGGPGMGKTHTVRNVLALLFAQREAARAQDSKLGPLKVALAAPTGKAAARIRESLLNNLEAFVQTAASVVKDPQALQGFLTNLQTKTLHRLLGVIHDNPTRFRHDEHNPLPYDLVVVDETSMVDFALMARLVDAIKGQTQLMLLGDRHQLASVEAGTVLADICGSVHAQRLALGPQVRARLTELDVAVPSDGSVPSGSRLRDCVVQLNRTHRFSQDSSIGRFALACLKEDFDPRRAAQPLFESSSADAVHLDPGAGRTLSQPVLDAMVQGYHKLQPFLRPEGQPDLADEANYHRSALDALDTFRVLCAHREGALGVHNVNEALRLEFTRRYGLSTEQPFWLGRPVMVRRNDYDVGLYNGDIGLVVSRLGPDGVHRPWVAFPGPDALEPDPARRDPAAKVVRYVPTSRLPEHETCLALTIHKSQGSEYAHVLVALPVRESPLVTRELLYTGITRARSRVTVVAQRAAFERALARTVQRASGLQDALLICPQS